MPNTLHNMLRPTDVAPPIIIGGCPRSGTTLLRTILDAHHRIGCGPETTLLLSAVEAADRAWSYTGERLYTSFHIREEDFASYYGHYLEAVLEAMRRDMGKSRIAEKSPQNVQYFSSIAWLLPDVPLVHIIRDGRAVVCSLLERNWLDDTGQPAAFTQAADAAADYWRFMVERGRRMRGHEHAHRYVEVFYEDLIRAPEKTLGDLLTFLGEPWDDRLLAHHTVSHRLEADTKSGLPRYESSIDRWQRDLTEAQQAVVYQRVGDLLGELGYV
jgi:hypothetical protein